MFHFVTENRGTLTLFFFERKKVDISRINIQRQYFSQHLIFWLTVFYSSFCSTHKLSKNMN